MGAMVETLQQVRAQPCQTVLSSLSYAHCGFTEGCILSSKEISVDTQEMLFLFRLDAKLGVAFTGCLFRLM